MGTASRSLVGVALVSAVVAVGCGGDDAETDADDAGAVVEQFLEALYAGDGDVACALVSANGEDEIYSMASALSTVSQQGTSCESQVYNIGGRLSGGSPPQLGEAEVDGDRASVASAEGDDIFGLVVVDDGWVVDSFQSDDG